VNKRTKVEQMGLDVWIQELAAMAAEQRGNRLKALGDMLSAQGYPALAGRIFRDAGEAKKALDRMLAVTSGKGGWKR